MADDSAHDSGHVSPTGGARRGPEAHNQAVVSSTPYHHNNYNLTHDSAACTPVRPDVAGSPAASTPDYDEDLSGCFSHFGATSPDSEYDEALAFPDSVTIVSMGGERPILVERPAHVHGTDTDSGHMFGHRDDHRDLLTSTDIPFQTLYGKPVRVKSVQRKVFIPGAEIHVEIVDHERAITSHLLNPNLYHIRLTHGPFTWTIKKRYKHISALHHQLLVFRTSLNFPFPTRSHKERRESFRNAYDKRTAQTRRSDENGETNGDAAAGEAAPAAAADTTTTPAMATTPIDTVDAAGMEMPANTTVQTVAVRRPIVAGESTPATKKKNRRRGALPRFPNRPESLVPVEALPERIRALESYLQAMLNIRLYRNHHETVAFLEVSQLSFVTGLGEAGKEALIMKRTGFTRPGQSGCNCMGCFHGACCVQCNLFCSGSWRQRWLFVRETCFGYLNPKDGSVRCVVLFDQGFDVSTGVYSTGMRNGMQLMTACREMVMKSWTRRKAKEWVAFLKEVAHGAARDFTCANPHGSFAPVRASTVAAWFVDGAAYMSAVADAMEAAREEIYVADWWLSPEIHMKRPAANADYWRLDQILKRKAVSLGVPNVCECVGVPNKI